MKTPNNLKQKWIKLQVNTCDFSCDMVKFAMVSKF